MNPTRRRPADRPDYRNTSDVHDVLVAARLAPDDEQETVRLWRTLRAEQPGLRSSTGGGRAGGHSDPTAATALGADPTRHALRRVEQCVTQLRAAATELAELRRVWLRTGADPTAEPEQREPGCEVMAKVGVWAPVHTKRKLPNGKGTIRLSRWAAEFIDEVKRPPTQEEAELHAQGKRVYVRPGADVAAKGGKR